MSLDAIREAFVEFVSVTDDFMGVPLLGATAETIPLIVPNTPFDENGNPIFEDIVENVSNLLGLDDVDNTGTVDEEVE